MDKPLRWLIAGVLIGAIVVTVMAFNDSNNTVTTADHARHGREFVAAWKKSRGVEFRATQTVQRSRNGHVVFTRVVTIDQQPPRFVSRSSDSIELINNGQLTNCSKRVENFVCARTNSPTWDALVASDVRNLNNYFFSKAPIYEVTKVNDNCFRLDNIYPSYPSPPYGLGARFCFTKTGRLSQIVVIRSTGNNDIKDVVSYKYAGKPIDSDFSTPLQSVFREKKAA